MSGNLPPDPTGRSSDRLSDTSELKTQEMQDQHQDQGGKSHRGHMIGMILCCIPMVVAIAWVLFATR